MREERKAVWAVKQGFGNSLRGEQRRDGCVG